MDHPEPWLIPFRHNAWATRDMLERCCGLTREQFHQRFDVGPGSLHDTFRHIAGAMLRWSDRVGQRPLRESIEKGGELSADEMLRKLDEAARDLEAVARDVYENRRFEERIEFPRGGDLPPWVFHKTTALVHVTTHGMHHRAQIRWMMRQLGMDLTPDWDAVEWELVETGQA
jgi:uncharacterized damage-inducible protein DinB